MVSFRMICEAMQPGRDFWDNRSSAGDLDDMAMSIIKRGLEIRPDRADGDTFWDDFINVISNNSESASRLLGVNSSVISKWTTRIRKAVDEVRDQNAGDDMVKTGDHPIKR